MHDHDLGGNFPDSVKNEWIMSTYTYTYTYTYTIVCTILVPWQLSQSGWVNHSDVLHAQCIPSSAHNFVKYAMFWYYLR